LGPRPTIATAKTAGRMASEIGADLSDRASEAAGWMPGTESREGLLNEGHSFGSLLRRRSGATSNLTQQLPCPATSALPLPCISSNLFHPSSRSYAACGSRDSRRGGSPRDMPLSHRMRGIPMWKVLLGTLCRALTISHAVADGLLVQHPSGTAGPIGEREFDGFQIYHLDNPDIRGLTDTCQIALTQTKCNGILRIYQMPPCPPPRGCHGGFCATQRRWTKSAMRAVGGRSVATTRPLWQPVRVSAWAAVRLLVSGPLNGREGQCGLHTTRPV
jgi:hypothetical protein